MPESLEYAGITYVQGMLPLNTLFDQIVQEIVERRQYQMDLEEVGSGDATRDQIADQIRVRVEHLKKIDPMRATMVVKQMMKSSLN